MPKTVLIVTSRLPMFTLLRDVVKRVGGTITVEMGLDQKSATECLALQHPIDVIVWDSLDDGAIIPLIQMAKGKFTKAKMVSINGDQSIRQAHLLAGCGYEVEPRRADEWLYELLSTNQVTKAEVA